MAESSELKIIITADDRARDVLAGNKKSLIDLGSLASGALKLGMVAGAAGVAVLGAGLVASVSAAGDAELAQADLLAVLESTGGVAGVTAAMANELASGFQNVTRFEDDVTLKGEAMLLTFTNIGKNIFPQTTETMLNMATKFGSVDAAALQLGKALQDPIDGAGALRRAGVDLRNGLDDEIKKYVELGDIEGAQKLILGELAKEFGGAARAAGDTFVGKLDILKNKFGDIQETIGGAMLPGLTLLGDKLITVLNQPEVQAAITAISTWLADTLPKAIDWGVKLLGDLQEVGLSGVLAKARVWSEDPGTQAFLQGVGTQVGAGIVEGIKITVTSIPVWTGMAVEMGKVAMPILLNVWKGLLKGGAISVLTALGLSPEDATSRVSGIMGFQSGGVVPGPMGRAQLAMVHGGETITPAGGSSGNMTFIYSPQVSLADEREIQARLIPALDRWWADAKRRRVVA